MRISLMDGRWFEVSQAQAFDEMYESDGKTSRATHSTEKHERLYRTRTGVFALYEWEDSEKGPIAPWCRAVERKKAAAWLIANGYNVPEDLRDIEAQLEI